MLSTLISDITIIELAKSKSMWECDIVCENSAQFVLNIISLHSYSTSIYDIAAEIDAGYWRRKLETCPRGPGIDRGDGGLNSARNCSGLIYSLLGEASIVQGRIAWYT